MASKLKRQNNVLDKGNAIKSYYTHNAPQHESHMLAHRHFILHVFSHFNGKYSKINQAENSKNTSYEAFMEHQ